MFRTIAAVGFLALLPVSATAQACEGQTQIEINFCAKARWEVADRELNRLWAVVKPMSDARATGGKLLQEQRAWLHHRDATCKPHLSGGGSAAPMFYFGCMEELTEARNDDFRALMR